MTYLFALADKVSDPYMLTWWCAVMIAFALQSFPWERDVRVKLPKLKLTKERKEITIGYERQDVQL